MDYTDDDCMNEFTPGQTDRLKQQIATFRDFTESGTKWNISSNSGDGTDPKRDLYLFFKTNKQVYILSWTKFHFSDPTEWNIPSESATVVRPFFGSGQRASGYQFTRSLYLKTIFKR